MSLKLRVLVGRALNYFIRGLLFVAPVGFTILILFSAFDFVDSLVRIKFNSSSSNQEFFIPGLGFLIVVIGTAFIGFLFTVLLPQTLQNYVERGFLSTPLVKIIYSAFKDLISAFVGDKKKFSTGVLISVNKENQIYKLGFLTQDNLDILHLPEMVAVYCPHSYAFSGELFIVPRESVSILSLSSAEVMKLIVSGGVSAN